MVRNTKKLTLRKQTLRKKSKRTLRRKNSARKSRSRDKRGGGLLWGKKKDDPEIVENKKRAQNMRDAIQEAKNTMIEVQKEQYGPLIAYIKNSDFKNPDVRYEILTEIINFNPNQNDTKDAIETTLKILKESSIAHFKNDIIDLMVDKYLRNGNNIDAATNNKEVSFRLDRAFIPPPNRLRHLHPQEPQISDLFRVTTPEEDEASMKAWRKRQDDLEFIGRAARDRYEL